MRQVSTCDIYWQTSQDGHDAPRVGAEACFLQELVSGWLRAEPAALGESWDCAITLGWWQASHKKPPVPRGPRCGP